MRQRWEERVHARVASSPNSLRAVIWSLPIAVVSHDLEELFAVQRRGRTPVVQSTIVRREPPHPIAGVNDASRGPASMEISYALTEGPAGVEAVHRVKDLAMESAEAKREEIEESERELANLKRILEGTSGSPGPG